MSRGIPSCSHTGNAVVRECTGCGRETPPEKLDPDYGLCVWCFKQKVREAMKAILRDAIRDRGDKL